MASRADDIRFRDLLAEHLGDEATAHLLERLPMTPANELATRADLQSELALLRGEMHHEFGRVRQDIGDLKGQFGELKGQFGELEGKFGTLRGEFGTLRGEFGELRAEFSDVRSEIHDLLRKQTWALAGFLLTTVAVNAGVTAALVG